MAFHVDSTESKCTARYIATNISHQVDYLRTEYDKVLTITIPPNSETQVKIHSALTKEGAIRPGLHFENGKKSFDKVEWIREATKTLEVGGFIPQIFAAIIRDDLLRLGSNTFDELTQDAFSGNLDF